MSVGVLLVDDEAGDLAFMKKTLELVCGFIVWGAGGYYEAVAVFDVHGDEITLLLTDVSLPGKTGVELAQLLLRRKPSLNVLLTSGWVGAAALRLQGVPPTDVHFLAKPFRYTELVERVRQVLASEEPVPWLTGGHEQPGTSPCGGQA